MIENYCTGASGFIGKRLVEKLGGGTVPIWHEDIWDFDYSDFKKFFFLSTYGNMATEKNEPEAILRANIMDVAVVLDAITRFKLKCESFVYVSSSSVNLQIQTPYSRTKRAAEEMIQAMPIPYCIVRPYSCTGVGEQKEHLISTLIRSCMEGTQMDFTPDAVHDYVDVEDVCDGLIALAEKKAVGVFEFGRGTGFLNAQVRQIVEDVCGKKANVRIVKQMRDYDSQEWYCCDFAARDFGWNPKKTLEQSIRDMVEDYQLKRDVKRICNELEDCQKLTGEDMSIRIR